MEKSRAEENERTTIENRHPIRNRERKVQIGHKAVFYYQIYRRN